MKMASKKEQYHCPPHHHWLITRILKPHVKLILWTHIPETLWHIDAPILIIRYVVSCWGTIEITLAVQNPTKFLNFRLENPDPRFFIPSQLHSRIVLLLSWIVQTKSGCTVGSRINCSCSSCSLQFNHPQVGQHRDGVTLMQKVSSQSRTLKMNVWIAAQPIWTDSPHKCESLRTTRDPTKRWSSNFTKLPLRSNDILDNPRLYKS